MRTQFHEKQKFTQWWLWLILIVVALIPVYGIYNQVIQEEDFGDKPMSNSSLFATAIISVIILLLFWFSKLETTIDQKQIRIKFSPFTTRVVEWKGVKSAKVIRYSFVGYGIRLFTKYGTVYNIKGDEGLALELNNGKELLVGTQKMEEVVGNVYLC
ncbi:phosphoethanolamine transferase domain-containing protein [Flavobacterium sp. 7A]|uniref:phosphoethanolamine transferase domain-containing protein n=1 Tax=Flavobacterium sp. 7A TaxID=2940571 RepID=UPI002225FD31|nr:phosphoethanolamine transferase domain-containing protein [Flavobacterium sp. 7A]MCW2119346.1 hypothetical protein [Flavobacterium sp. 7A]